MPAAKRPNRRKLTFEDIKALEAAAVDGYEAVARDAFLFSFYARGMRFGDLCRLKRSDIDGARMEYVMMKTGQQVRGRLPDAALAIIERYRSDESFIFPFLVKGDETDPVFLRRRISSRNVQVNAALKTTAIEAGLKPDGLSMHVARHSYADFARRKSGNVHAIMEALGHTSLVVTQSYLKSLNKDASDELDDQLWSQL